MTREKNRNRGLHFKKCNTKQPHTPPHLTNMPISFKTSYLQLNPIFILNEPTNLPISLFKCSGHKDV